MVVIMDNQHELYKHIFWDAFFERNRILYRQIDRQTDYEKMCEYDIFTHSAQLISWIQVLNAIYD